MTERDERCCPHLGLRGDSSTFFIYPTPLHRCYRPIEPAPIHPDDQEHFCLGGHWRECPRIVGPAATEMKATEEEGEPVPEPEEVADASAWETWETVPPVRPSEVNWKRRLLILGAALLFLCPGLALLAQNPDVRAFLSRLPILVGLAPTATPTPTKTPIRLGPVPIQPSPTDTPTITPTGTRIATWTPTPTDTPTITPTPTWTPTGTPVPTDTPIPTATPTPTDTPTLIPSPTPLPTATPVPAYRQRGASRYHPSCVMTKVFGYVYDDFGDPVAGMFVKLWNDWGYTAPLAQTDGPAGANGEGYYEIYLDSKPKEGIWYLALVDPVDGHFISTVVKVKTTDGECNADSTGRQVVEVNWVKVGP